MTCCFTLRTLLHQLAKHYTGFFIFYGTFAALSFRKTPLMKTFLLNIAIFFCLNTIAQVDSTIKIVDSTIIREDNIRLKDNTIYDTSQIDSRPKNIYGDLLNDDPEYNPKYPWTTTALRVGMVNVFSWATSRYIFNFEWARISPTTWKNNLRSRWIWDDDRFGTNFIGHPHTGNLYFNVARSNGYSYWKSLPYAIGGSLMWEYLGENTGPSKNDLINTPFSGMFLGEVLYRISSNILDDRTRGSNRFWRELLAGVINPPRALNRLTQGKMFRVTNKEVYQKEPLNITFSAGAHRVNENNKFGTGTTTGILNLQFDYGDPFEVRKRKPFDVFRLRLESRVGAETKFLDNTIGYGLLFGKNVVRGHGLIGGFQYFDYWNNRVFEMGSLGFGVGLISRIPFPKTSYLYSSIHIAAVPLSANKTNFGPDTSPFRDYTFAGGLEAKIEETFNINKYASIGLNAYYYWTHNYEDLPGRSSIGIIKPRATVKLFGNMSLGFEHHIYFVDEYLENTPTLHLKRTEQKAFLQWFFEDSKRKGRYN